LRQNNRNNLWCNRGSAANPQIGFAAHYSFFAALPVLTTAVHRTCRRIRPSSEFSLKVAQQASGCSFSSSRFCKPDGQSVLWGKATDCRQAAITPHVFRVSH
jgi:hypothetical protein